MALLDAGQGGGITLTPHDTNGTAEGAEAAARKALDDGAGLILGPLFSHEVRGAAGPARERGVAMIAFTNDADVASEGVFVMGLLPSAQVRRVVAEAAAGGGKRVAVLAPASPYGQRGAQAAEEIVPQVGGRIVAVEFYDPAGTDAQETARRLARQAADFVVLPEAPQRHAARFFYDSLVYDAGYLRYLMREFAPGQFFLGTDFPYAIQQTGVRDFLVAATDGDSAHAVYEAAARRFLGMGES